MAQHSLGSASLHLVNGVLLFNEDVMVFEAMLEGWSSQMIGGRRLQKPTVANRLQVIRQFQRHAADWPWKWTAAMLDDWMSDPECPVDDRLTRQG